MSGHALVRSGCPGEKPATSFPPSHAPQEVFSDWLADKKPSAHQKVNLATALSANHVAVRQFVGVRIKDSVRHGMRGMRLERDAHRLAIKCTSYLAPNRGSQYAGAFKTTFSKMPMHRPGSGFLAESLLCARACASRSEKTVHCK